MPSIETVRTSNTAKVFNDLLERFDIKGYCDEVWKLVSANDRLIQAEQPFKLLKSTNPIEFDRGLNILSSLREDLMRIGLLLEPVMPSTAIIIQDLVKANKMPEKPLFLRK